MNFQSKGFAIYSKVMFVTPDLLPVRIQRFFFFFENCIQFFFEFINTIRGLKLVCFFVSKMDFKIYGYFCSNTFY